MSHPFLNFLPVLVFVVAIVAMVVRSRGIMNAATVFRFLFLVAFLVIVFIRMMLRARGH